MQVPRGPAQVEVPATRVLTVLNAGAGKTERKHREREREREREKQTETEKRGPTREQMQRINGPPKLLAYAPMQRGSCASAHYCTTEYIRCTAFENTSITAKGLSREIQRPILGTLKGPLSKCTKAPLRIRPAASSPAAACPTELLAVVLCHNSKGGLHLHRGEAPGIQPANWIAASSKR